MVRQPPVPEEGLERGRAQQGLRGAALPCCTICLEGGDEPLPVQCGCACRGAAGLAHVACMAQAAAHRGVGWNTAWEGCRTCGQRYTGGMRTGLARSSSFVWRTERRAPEDRHRLRARGSLREALRHAGECTQAEVLPRYLLAIRLPTRAPALRG